MLWNEVRTSKLVVALSFVVIVTILVATSRGDKPAHAGPLVSADHSTLVVKARNGYYWDVEVNRGEPQRIQAIRDTDDNVGRLELDIRDILATPGTHTVRITVYNHYGTTARIFPVVTFDVWANGTFTYRNSPLYLGIKFKRTTDLKVKED